VGVYDFTGTAIPLPTRVPSFPEMLVSIPT